MLYNFIDFFHRALCVEVIALWSLLSELFSAQSESADHPFCSNTHCDHVTTRPSISHLFVEDMFIFITLISQTHKIHNDYENRYLFLGSKSQRGLICCSTP